MTSGLWTDFSPSRRCQWVDLLRGLAVIVMIEVHVVNTWLKLELRPEWLNYVNGLVAPSFLMCAGFALVLSTFKADGTLRPFWPDTARRLGFILLCAYLLHAPGLTLAEWTVLGTPAKMRELFKIDVLQCTVYSLLILQAIARTLGTARRFTLAALALALFVALVSPTLWIKGVGEGVWLPLRGLLNGNDDHGLKALFPLFPWLAFVSFGGFLGGAYRFFRAEVVGEAGEPRARWTEARFLLALLGLGLALTIWGSLRKNGWIWEGTWRQTAGGTWLLNGYTWSELTSFHNTTLPSVAERLGWICMGGAALGLLDPIRPKLPGANPVEAAGRESLLLYMLHLNLIYGLLMTPFVVGRTGWDWNTQGWAVTLLLTATIMGLSLWAGVLWQRMRQTHDRMRAWQRAGLAVLALNFIAGGWLTFRFLLQSPELAREPYPFLNAARERKGLKPTADGLARDPEEVFKEEERLGRVVTPEARIKRAEQIRAR